MKDSNTTYETLMKNSLALTEFKHILQKTQTFFEEVIKHICTWKSSILLKYIH